MKHFQIIIVFALLVLSTTACKEKYTPKPKGYFRINFPEKEYARMDSTYPFKFDYPRITQVEKDQTKGADKYWINVEYPNYNAKIHLSYKAVDNNLEEYLEDSRKMAYKHSIKADAISEQAFYNLDKKVYALFYRLKGNAASSVQFVATDSSKHFLRGALYFKNHPNQDSLAPVIQYIDQDMIRLVETLEWK